MAAIDRKIGSYDEQYRKVFSSISYVDDFHVCFLCDREVGGKVMEL